MMDNLLQGAILSAQRYSTNRNDSSSLIQLENRLESLIAVSQDLASTIVPADAQWTDDNLILIEWFSYCCNLLTPPDPPPVSLASKIIAFLHSFAWYSFPARRYFQTELNLASTLSLCVLRTSSNDGGHMYANFVLQSVKLLQIVTYGPAARESSTHVSSDLLVFLIKNACTKVESMASDQMRFSLGVLNNLCSNSNAARDSIRKSNLIADLCRNLLLLLSDRNRDVVVNCVSLIMQLDESLKEKVFNSRNLSQTFQCTFNVLQKGDQFMARHYAVDLFVRMIDSASIRQALAAYKSLDESMTAVCSLLVLLDEKREPFYKVYELLLKCCKTDLLRRATCRALMHAGPVTERLVSPLIAVTECARSPIEQAPFPDLPTRAMKLLKHVVEEIAGSGHRIADYVSPDILQRLIEDCLKATIETGRPILAAHKSKRIVQCLRLATIASREDADFRTDLLELITPALCGHLAEFQMLSNPIVSSFANLAATKEFERQLSRSDGKLLWQGVGAQILFTLIDFLRLQEKYSKSHREQYSKLMKDARVVPFLAYGMTSQNKKMVCQAFQIAFTMAQDAEFPDAWLSDLIAQNVRNIRHVSGSTNDQNNRFSEQSNNGHQNSNGVDTRRSINHLGAQANGNGDSHAVDDIIATMKSNLNVQDAKMSQVMDVYERKIALMEANERQLQEIIHARSSALQQSDRLLNQYRSNRGDVEQETTKLRAFLRATESKNEQLAAQLTNLNADLEKSRLKSEQMEKKISEKQLELETYREIEENNQSKLKNLSEEVTTLKAELESEKELHGAVRNCYDKMKKNFDLMNSKLTEAVGEVKELKKQVKHLENGLKTSIEENEELKESIASKDEEISGLEKSVEKLQDAFQNVDKEKTQLQAQLAESERESNRKTGLITEQEKSLQKLSEEISTYSKILESMHKLSSKAVYKS